VVKAAGEVFARRGFHAAALDEISAAAGVSKGAVYYNFEGKEDLFLALLQDRLSDRLEQVRGSNEELEGDLISPARRFVAAVENDPRWPPLFFEFVAYAARDRGIRKQFARRFVTAGRAEITALIDEQVARHALVLPLPANELALLLSALVNGLLIERLFDPDGVPDDLIDRAFSLLTSGAAERA